MTITIHWWWVPTALAIGGIFAVAYVLSKRRGDYDFSILLELPLALMPIVAAIGVLIGHFFA